MTAERLRSSVKQDAIGGEEYSALPVIILQGQTPSKKNSKRLFHKNGRNIIISSKQYLEWEKTARIAVIEWKKANHYTLTYPIRLHMFFYRDSKRRWDYNNIGQGVQDILVDAGIIEDDDAYHCIPVYDGFEVDKDNPRVEVRIEAG